MTNTYGRQKDVLKIISGLDISPTMFKNATEKYNTIAKYLHENGLVSEIYPQGSFSLGTVVRPVKSKKDKGYDLDFICQVKGDKNEYTPSELRKKLQTLLSSEKYGGKLEICQECFTIHYAEVNDIGFSIDIVPATDELTDKKESLRCKSHHPELIDTAIAIPRYNGERNYTWLTNNPKGLRTWFEEINAPYLFLTRNAYRNKLFQENTALFSSVDAVPAELERSVVQRVIQILKYHRDVYYSQILDGDKLKPISAIITVTVARIAEHHAPTSSVFEFLQYVLQELEIYSKHMTMSQPDFQQKYGERTAIRKSDGKWYIPNPANPEDNLADKWNMDIRIPQSFFRWIDTIRVDLFEALESCDDVKFRAVLENGFGKDIVKNTLGDKYCKLPDAEPISPIKAAKPYMAL